MVIPHFTLDLRLGREGGYRVDHHDIYRTGTHQHVGNFQSLFAGIWLGNQQFIHINTQFFGIHGIQGMFGVDKRRRAAGLLCLGNDLQGQSRLAGRLRAVDLNHPTLGQTTHPESDIQSQGPGRDGVHFAHCAGIAHAHD